MVIKKKRRLSKKGRLVIFFVCALIVLGGAFFGFQKWEEHQFLTLGYSKEAYREIKSENLKDYVKNVGENKTLNICLESADFKKENVDSYVKINYQDQSRFVTHVNSLLDLGYTVDDINLILARGSDDDVEAFLAHEKVDDVSTYLTFDFAKLNYWDRYEAYQREELTIDEKTVVYVNIGLDKEFYTDYQVIHDYSVIVLANKYNQLSREYVPDDLVSIPEEYCLNEDQKMVEEARDAFVEMAKKAEEDGLTLRVRSSYRTYEQQEAIYNDYLENYGQARADSIAARPGFSEHQTGLVIDIATSQTSVFSSTEEYQWMKNNAHLYGFIQRYPEGKSDVTGYNNEAWHYRYLGVDLATKVHDSGLTYDEYYVMYLDQQ